LPDSPAEALGIPISPCPAGKRLLDIALAAMGLVVLSPLWALVAAAVKLQDGGPVYYAQERTGQGGRTFTALKFRSMVPDAERGIGAVQALHNDPRVTPIGRMLRAAAIDELPQLWSIFKGDMSFVGPRALRPGEIEAAGSGVVVPIDVVPGYAERCSLRPGLTGIAQIYAPRDLPRWQKFRYDRLYISRQSLWLDVRLILLSVWITLRGTWEVQGKKF
jgi:lipopolysaccharide/colanic/teichoic acid biosynthesis glycosyltransferase